MSEMIFTSRRPSETLATQSGTIEGDSAIAPNGIMDEPSAAPGYVKPVLKVGSENPSGKLGGNACCGHC